MSQLIQHLRQHLPENQVITDDLRLLAYGTDASFYRLIPEVITVIESENDLPNGVDRSTPEQQRPVTFRAAGTSLSGQAISDGVLALIGEGFATYEINADASKVKVGPGIIGGEVNRRLAPHGKQDRPRSGLDQRLQDRRHRRQQRFRHVLRHGAEQLPDTGRPARDAGRRHRARYRRSAQRRCLHQEPCRAARRTGAPRPRHRDNAHLAERIRHKFKIKNTTGYSLNALVDYEHPIDILAT
jgi:D-lactate dehydrogenase